ncbi:DMP19 family protein [Methyloversatilis sp. NSM2]|uniref:DMP19 family protein n=1 Tax=Methyloversatilis sp. NSM2 TaxID=3134135 RepID=UPI003111678C
MFKWFRKPKHRAEKTLTAEDHLAPDAPFNPNNFSPWHGFRSLTPAVLASVADNDIHRAISNHVRLKEADVLRAGRQLSRQDFTNEVLLLHAVWILEAEVRNGAFTQFFGNHDAQAVRDAIAGLRMIGAESSLRVLQEAIGVFSHHFPYLLTVVDEYSLPRPSEIPDSETVTHDFHVHQSDLDACRVRFMRAMSAAQLAPQ